MKKNIIIFHTDQQRYDSLGCNGSETAKTPNIDSLAKDGSRFTRHIGANPVCMPSRSSFFTGQYVPGHGVSSNGVPLWSRDKGCDDKNDFISVRLFGEPTAKKVPTIANILGDEGWHTASFGKLHLNPHLADPDYDFYESYSVWERPETEFITKPFYGFQTYKLILGHGEAPCGYNRGHYGRWLNREYPEIAKQVLSGEDVNTKNGSLSDDIYKSKLPSELHNSMWIASEACEYLDGKKDDDTPVFMFLGFPDPHHPITPPEDIVGEFEDLTLPEFIDRDKLKGDRPGVLTKAFKGLSATQDEITRAYRYTQASIHLIDRAVGKVVNKLKELGVYEDTTIIFTSDHGDFLGDFGMVCKGNVPCPSLVHIPFILKPAKGKELDPVIDTPMSNADVVPTLLSMYDVNVPHFIQGIDIRSEEAKTNTPMVTCYSANGTNRNISLYDDTYRYTYDVTSKLQELYNHKEDPMEYENLATTQKEKYKVLCDQFKTKLFTKHLDCDNGIYNHYGLW